MINLSYIERKVLILDYKDTDNGILDVVVDEPHFRLMDRNILASSKSGRSLRLTELGRKIRNELLRRK